MSKGRLGEFREILRVWNANKKQALVDLNNATDAVSYWKREVEQMEKELAGQSPGKEGKDAGK